MQKSVNETNTNTVGATSSRPYFEGMTLKNQNGITLIALIITIIVMLILVGVTINVALNGGLFEKAETAASGTEKQAIYEQIVDSMELTNDGKISVKGTFDNVIAEFGADKVTNISPATVDENTTEVTFSVVGKTGTYNYKILGTNIEKDPIDNSNAQPPSEIAGNVYEGVMGTIYLAKNYNYGWFPRGATRSLLSYEYKDGIITAYDLYGSITYNFSVSNDTKTITINFEGIDYTFTLAEGKEYNPKFLTEQGMYEGVYYNKQENKFACASHDKVYTTDIVLWFQNEGWGVDAASQASTFVNISNEGKTIQLQEEIFEGECLEYTLLEAGEF